VEIYHRDRPFLFLYNYTWFWVTSDKLRGFVPYPAGQLTAAPVIQWHLMVGDGAAAGVE
jgi:ABC-type transport system substrate-binding protein